MFDEDKTEYEDFILKNSEGNIALSIEENIMKLRDYNILANFRREINLKTKIVRNKKAYTKRSNTKKFTNMSL